MEQILEQLVTLLKQEVTLHEELAQHFAEELQSIGHRSGAELLKLQTQKVQCYHKITLVENSRIEVVQQLAQAWDLKEPGVTLRQIITRASEPFSVALQECFDQLKQLVTNIQKVAEQIHRVTEARLKPVEASLRFLSKLKKRQHTYSETGVVQPPLATISRGAI